MDEGYRVTDVEGREHGPVSAVELEKMYREGRVNKSSRVYDSFAGQWRKLEEVIDLSVWDQWRGQSAEPQPSSPPPPTFMPTLMGITTPSTDEPRTSGMVAAAVLLFINAALTVLDLMFLTSQNVKEPGGVVIAAPVWSVIVGVGLLRGKDAWKQWAMISAVLSAAVFGIILPLIQQTIPGFITGLFQIVYSIGMFVLLFGGVPSRERVLGGVITVVFAWLGVIGGGVAEVVITGVDEKGSIAAINTQREIERQAIPTSQFSDQEVGVTVNFPSGWALLPADNSVLPLPDAKMIAINMRTGCWAVLVVENIPVGLKSLNHYLDLILINRQSQAPGLKDLGRSDVMLGNMSGRRMTLAWEQSGHKFIGYNSVCRVGSDYYLLSGWSVEEASLEAFESFQSLEESFEITGPPASDDATERMPPARERK